jgi:site-specific DNA-methyltransferase (adenine-specific)
VSEVVVEPAVLLPLPSLQLWSENPRTIRPSRLDDLVSSLRAEPDLLWAKPLWIDEDGVIFAGNQRYRAALELGLGEVPVQRVRGLTPSQKKTWALLDNNTFGVWDTDALAPFLADLLGEGVDAVLTGFETRELDAILATLTPAHDPEEIPPVPRVPVSRPGELFTLGRSRLLCGDSTDLAQLQRVVAGETVAALVTDFPWGVSYTGKTPEALTLANDDAAGQSEFLARAFAALDAVLEPRTPFYLFIPSGHAGTEFLLALRAIGWEHRQTLIWCKDAFVLGHSDYHNRHESIVYGFTPGPGRVGRGAGRRNRWYGGNDQSSVLFFDRPKASREHPTAKPVELVAALIRNSTRRGDLVLDPFAGSGSTLLACERLGRRCATVELDPRYTDVVRARFPESSGG